MPSEVKYFILLLKYRAIFDTSAKQSEAHVLKWCIKNCSIVKLYNKVLIITNVCTIAMEFMDSSLPAQMKLYLYLAIPR